MKNSVSMASFCPVFISVYIYGNSKMIYNGTHSISCTTLCCIHHNNVHNLNNHLCVCVYMCTYVCVSMHSQL